MKASHFHVGVRDLEAAIAAFERLWEMKPVFQNARMATLRFGNLGLLVDKSEQDTLITIAFESVDCDADFARLVAHGAEPLELPATKPWGVRVAYLKGPGAITFEIEQVLPEGE
jgi:predicted enzyme related to lactoylglutathione lyase